MKTARELHKEKQQQGKPEGTVEGNSEQAEHDRYARSFSNSLAELLFVYNAALYFSVEPLTNHIYFADMPCRCSEPLANVIFLFPFCGLSSCHV